MKKSLIKIFSLLLAISMFCSILTACGSSTNSEKESINSTTKTAGATESKAAESKASVYPLDTKVTLKYWLRLTTAKISDMSETEFAKTLMKNTGVNIEFISPPFQQENDSFNIMIASGDLPDIIQWHWGYASYYSGGPLKALDDGLIMPLNESIEKWAPNFKKLMEANPAYDNSSKTDDGTYWGFPSIRGDKIIMVYQGPIIRKDWLDDLGLQIPVTIDDWYNVLKAFKEKKNADAPLSYFETPTSLISINGAFSGAYGVIRNFYVEDGKIKYGSIEPGMKEFLKTFGKWYEEGLLDRNFGTVDQKILDANITSGKTGATLHNSGGGMGKWMPAMAEKDAKFNLAGAPYPVLNKGETPKFGQLDAAIPGLEVACINPKSKNIETAVRLLDYGYSEEGHMLFNFGLEGTSYKMEDGYPKYTELITKNPDGLSITDAMAQYLKYGGGPFVSDKRYGEQMFVLPQQKDAVLTWSKTDMEKHNLPLITNTSEESAQISKLYADIKTYENEMFLKFVMGVEPLENFDSYVEQIKKLGIEEVIALKQAALDRYNNR